MMIKMNKDNHLLYAVPYQHFTNSIEKIWCKIVNLKNTANNRNCFIR